MKVVAVYLLAVLRGNASPSTDDLKVILGSGVEPKQRGKGELYFIIMEAASCSLELCEELRRKEDAIARGMIMGAAASTEKYLYRSGVGQSRSSAGIKLTIVVCL
ncbi:uncharacterized protein LOC108466839 isoform X2 [Gossypium arboreum]|uniref:uncharacterized protein LOC108466839 isoform X2 n=1 Tax=Gossypium arboreum TaxID=29729 RepID=UPI0008194CFB|nr:uncharacterized protein LOC108466839 isoform X2 [Gossypium arboreum]